MTQLHLIEQAKQGDPGAIAELMNKSLQPKGMTAAVERYGDRLEVVLEAERVPNRQALTAFVEKGISNLGIQVIKFVRVSGRETGASFATWTEELHLNPEMPLPEFEPEALVGSAMTNGSETHANVGVTATKSNIHEDFSMGAVVETVQHEQRLNELTQITNLSQLQDLLSEEPEHPVSERQRQLLEEQIETIWQEQSAQADNFLTDLMSSAPEEPAMQFEEFSDSPSGVQFPEEEPSDRSFEQDFSEFSDDAFLSERSSEQLESSDLSPDLDSSGLDFEALTESADFSPSEHPSSDWIGALENEEDEPDEILTDFMDSQPLVSGRDLEAGDETDERDEILAGFLPQPDFAEPSPDHPGVEDAPQWNGDTDELDGLLSEEAIVNFFEETTEPIDEFTTPTPVAEDSITFLRDLPDEFTADSYEMAVDTPDSDLSFLDEAQTAIEFPDTTFAEPDFPPSPPTGEFGSDEFSSEFGSFNDFGTEEFRYGSSELSFDDVSQTNDVSLTFDDSSSGQPGSLTDSPAELWDQPPIEFLQGEPDLSLPDMPTEQLEEPSAEFMVELSDPSDSFAPLGDVPGDFPQSFLESQEPSGESSEEVYVDPNENPFIEQMEENRDRPDEFPSDQPKSADKDFESLDETFNQADWQLPDDEPNFAGSDPTAGSDDFDLSGLSADLSELSLEAYEPADSSPESSEEFLSASDPIDELSDEALDNFFATSSQSPSEEIDPAAPMAPSIDSDFQLDQYGQPDAYLQSSEFGQSSAFGSLDDLGQPDSYSPSGEFEQPEAYRQDDAFGLDEPFAPSSSSLPTRPPTFPDNEMSESEYPPTEIPGSELADTQIPMREELSQEALEEQLAAYEFGQPSGEAIQDDRTVDRDDRMIPVDSDAEAPAETRGSPWLFPLIFLGISGWIVGLISFAFLWSRLSSPPPLFGQDDSSQPADVADAADGAAPAVADCTPPPAGGTPVALSNLQFQPNTANPQQINLVGCVTNRTEQAIDIVSVAYRSGAGGAEIGGLEIPDNLVQPGQTVIFTSRFTVPSDVSNVVIDTVFWQPAGGTASEEAGTSIQVDR